MCAMLKTEPREEDIPITREDLTFETQLVFNLYDILPSKWEGFSGSYLGKDLNILPILFDFYEFDRPLILYSWNIIPIIDSFVSKDIGEKIKAKNKQSMKQGELAYGGRRSS